MEKLSRVSLFLSPNQAIFGTNFKRGGKKEEKMGMSREGEKRGENENVE